MSLSKCLCKITLFHNSLLIIYESLKDYLPYDSGKTTLENCLNMQPGSKVPDTSLPKQDTVTAKRY